MSRDSVHLIVIVLLFLCLGLVMLFSASGVAAEQNPRFQDSGHFVKKQATWTLVALLVLIATSRIPFEFWSRTRTILLGATVLLLVLVLVPGIGSQINGARRWLYAGGWYFQPSELAKLTGAIFVCGHLAADPARIPRFREGFLPAFAAMLLLCALIVVQPDLGTSAFIGMVLTVTLVVAGVRSRHLVPPLAAGAAAAGLYVATRLDHVWPRIKIYLDPGSDPLGAGHQIKQSLIALGAGGLWGEGLGRGTQKLFFLPEVHSDFIFPVIGEELGFLGALSVVMLYVAFGVTGWRIMNRAGSPFAHLLAFSLTVFILLQAAFNLMVVTALVPTKGIPLPFLSFGGSSLCFTLAAAGILINISNRSQTPDPGPPQEPATS
jgi:cell division protein FtsW